MATGGTRVRLLFDAAIPSGASVTPSLSGDSGTYAAMDADGSTPLDDGYREYGYSASIVDVDTVRVKLTLTGTSLARPSVKNLRVMVI